MNKRGTWNKNSKLEEPKYRIQQNYFPPGRGQWIFNADQSPLISQDFGNNPLLSNSKMWKGNNFQEILSPVTPLSKNEDDSNVIFYSPDENECNVPSENQSPSPEDKMMKL